MKTLVALPTVCFMALSLSGCIARLLVIDGAELAVMRRAATAGIAETRAAGGLLRATRMGITAEQISVFTRSAATIRAGRLLAADEVAFNSQLGKMRLVRSGATNPRLILRGASEPFAEVLPKEGRIRLFDSNVISLHNDIYSVESEIVFVRRAPSIASDNVIATLRQGDLAVRLTENGGWYQVRVIQGGQELTGFLEASLLAPLVLLGSREDRENRSPQLAIAGEVRERWNYYWATPGGNDVPEVTADDAMNILYGDFGIIGADRRIAYRETDWPRSVRSFLRIDVANLPILSTNTFKDEDLKILGFTIAGELLQYVAFRVIGEAEQPLDWVPKTM